MKLSFEKLKDLFPNGKMDKRGKNWITNCPSCGFMEFSISIEDNHLCGCYRKKECGWTGNIYSLAIKIGRPDIIVNKDIKFDKLEKISLLKNNDDLNLEVSDISMPIGWMRVFEDEYLSERHFNEFNRYKVGITTIDPRLTNFIVFGIEEDRKIKAWIGRNRKSKKEIERINKYYKLNNINKKIARYLNSDSDFGKLLLGLDEITEETETIIIVEGIFDKFNIDKLLVLYNQHKIVCVCSFKCSVSKEQIFKIQQRGVSINSVILIYDPDVIESIKETAFELNNYFNNVLVGFNDFNDKDPGEFEIEDLERIFENLKSPSYFNIKKINPIKLKI